ncbi:hypothetical protein C499_02409 [Halogeometricum borinquense DSM 11551]|uniref:Putative sensor domain-containing protein n=2 Tax=Halogeometricum borinquense TaxID=60847 RepID=E4NPT9_HALBP|nr:sensor domain-containing protein [Halogeometricum borinquense]ADQ66572.1 hypothetical protein Hbor_09780 [Halogeometricum borinquense DSM 11551]ELY30680.1 hypothetical protein C499_02409 [Halogeometricum borinquense DSM 11551]RYJ14430.1 hypothetical protein ELS19_11005 [Halogeometricum borinquense]
MLSDALSGASVGPTLSVRSAVTAPLRLQTYRNLLYLSLAFPLGLLYFLFFSIGFSVGVSLTFVVIGIPILLFVLAAALGLASVERKLATLLLGVSVRSPTTSSDGPLVERVKQLVVSQRTWKAVFYLASKLILGLISFTAIMSLLTTAVSFLMIPFVYDQPGVYVGIVTSEPAVFRPQMLLGWDGLLVGVRTAFRLTSWQVTTLSEALAVAGLGVILGIVTLNILNGLAWLSGQYTVLLLDEDDADASPEANAA